MRRIATMLAVSALLSGGKAWAEEASEPEPGAESVTTERRPSDISLLMQFDTTLSGDNGRNYYEEALSFRLRAEVLERLTGELALGISLIDIDLFKPDGAPLDAELHLPWRTTIGCGARLVLFRWRHLDLSIFAEFTFPIAGDDVEIESTTFYDELALLNIVDINDIRSWVTVRHRYYRMEFGMTLRGILGRWRPFFDIKYVHMPGELELQLQEELASFMALLSEPVPLVYDASFMSMFYAVGFEVELGRGFELELRVAASPMVGDGWVFVGRLALEVPLTTRLRRNWPDRPDLRGRRRHGP
ncbi:MAG: hypothetical protein U9Q03_01475 [Patescibacteria group bacterium]|nr:hypothetical protein [Patescibacteria group bacterium]